MSGDLSLRDHALRVGVLKVIADETARTYKGAREDAQAAFAPARADGQSQQKVLLPDGTDIGLISIRDGGKTVDVTEAALAKWCDEHLPGAWEEYADESALTNADVLDVLKAVFPDLVKRRIRPATRAALLKEIEESGGYLVDQEEGVKEKVGDVVDCKPTGEFSFRPAKGARDLVVAAWQRGELRGVALEPLALPVSVPQADPWHAARESDPWTAPEPADIPNGGLGPFGDEHGFRDPEAAAAHAVLVQGGYSTPPREAYRMLRDGGTGAERARTWLLAHGLDPEDPSGEDVPWPLSEGGGS